MEFSSIPEEFVVNSVGSGKFEIPDNTGKLVERFSVGIYTTDNKFISENSVFALNVTDELVQVKLNSPSPNKGSYYLKMDNVNPNLLELADSHDGRLMALVGKKIKTEKFDGFTLKPEAYEDGNMFVKTNTDATRKALLKLREPKTFRKMQIIE